MNTSFHRTRHLLQAAWLAPAIPYRTDAPVSGASYATALLVTLLLIALLVGALLFVRRRGWLAWSATARSQPATEGIQVQASRRLSIASTAHVVSYGGSTYLIVESTRGANATVTRIEAGEPDGAAS
ncbi:hypothetical protein [Dyella acidiphila]|uniref:Flagellar biosynthesis protein, FliO n=1 Tax=Dyella acidiphila TaxID=2775866 RepID=A0ABR9GFB4_9GAMM|nr:hypothetical protein [Dyella acidiphila]MBE1162747.1 hypothetical protein [Dyella acidiphila]